MRRRFHLRVKQALEVPGPVAGPIVDHDCFHRDADNGGERVRPIPETCGGLPLLVIEDLGTHQPGVVVDGVVEIPVTA